MNEREDMTEMMIEERLPRKLGGKIIKWCFILFNILMVFWLIAGFSSASETIDGYSTELEQSASAIGAGIGAVFLMFIWVVGVVVLTPFLLLTRGKKVYKKISDEKED